MKRFYTAVCLLLACGNSTGETDTSRVADVLIQVDPYTTSEIVQDLSDIELSDSPLFELPTEALSFETSLEDSETIIETLIEEEKVDETFEVDVIEPPPPFFDFKLIKDQASAACNFTASHTVLKNGVLLEAFKVSYLSFELVDGVLKEILIRGFGARPVGSNVVPGIVNVHGLGGFANEDLATGLAALTGTFVVAYTGPGGGNIGDPDTQSEGTPPSGGEPPGYRLFDTVPDPRGSWLWAHAVAAMRALTCLESRPDVDRDRLGITGFSAGGIVSLIAASVDDRIKAAVPLSGTGGWDVSVLSENSWFYLLLDAAGLTTSSPEWGAFLQHLDPVSLLNTSAAPIMMVNGTVDEFFPLTAFNATYQAISSSPKRMSLAANFDHGCYSLLPLWVEDKKTIEERADLHAKGAQRLWFGHWFKTGFPSIPAEPTAQVLSQSGLSMVVAAVDEGGYIVEDVRTWVSIDDAYTFWAVPMKESLGLWVTELLPEFPKNAVWFVDVIYRTKDLIAPDRFSISSVPVLPDGFIPHIRKAPECE